MLPEAQCYLTNEEVSQVVERVREPFLAAAAQMRIDHALDAMLVEIYVPLAALLARRAKGGETPVIGINGAQGAGKSTLCRLLEVVLGAGFDLRVAGLSIDDLYLTAAQRQKLADEVHPLLATRGVPGTHDVKLGLQLFSGMRQLQSGEQLAVPVFDKAIDDRLPEEEWRRVTGPLDLILFEGWCVGAVPQAEADLARPLNQLEQDEDPQQAWRRFVNRRLEGDYRQLFANLDYLVMLKIPGWASVLEWRGKQERKLAEEKRKRAHKVMDSKALERFIMHYERLTRAMLAEMPARANLVLELNEEHRVHKVRCNEK